MGDHQTTQPDANTPGWQACLYLQGHGSCQQFRSPAERADALARYLLPDQLTWNFRIRYALPVTGSSFHGVRLQILEFNEFERGHVRGLDDNRRGHASLERFLPA